MNWVRSPSGVYQSTGGKYVLRPVGSGVYAVDILGKQQTTVDGLDRAKNWCEEDRTRAAAMEPTAPATKEME